MALMLEVVGVHAASMGTDVRRLLGGSELKIGRDSDNDWILPQSYVSRHQAVIRCVNGMYFLEQVGSCPIILNDAARPLERNRIVRLSAGDRIMIDDIEIQVLESDAMWERPPSADGPTVYPSMAPAPPADLPLSRGAAIDPLEMLGVRPPEPPRAAPRTPEFGSTLDEAIVPGAVASPQSATALPDNWFATGSRHAVPSAPVIPVAPAVPPRGEPPVAPPTRGMNINSPLCRVRRATADAAGTRVDEADAAARGPVEMTVFGPSVLTRRERFFIQAVFHWPKAENEAYRVASLAQHNPQIAQRLSLTDGIEVGTAIRVRVCADSRVTIDEPEQVLHWRGATTGVQFMVQIPRIDWRSDYLFVIEVEVDGAPIGRCKFRLTTVKQTSSNGEPRACGKLNRYERVFLSYASEDASVVSSFAQVLEAQGLDYFLDVLSLRSGVDWQSKLKEHIERSDLFLLCWSRHAARSAWVRKEIEWALSAQRREPTRRPDIRPLLLDGPPVPPPPRSLRHLHFNSATRYVHGTGAG